MCIRDSYLLMPNISIAGELAIMGAAIIGALIGFLWFNAYPAEVFMLSLIHISEPTRPY